MLVLCAVLFAAVTATDPTEDRRYQRADCTEDLQKNSSDIYEKTFPDGPFRYICTWNVKEQAAQRSLHGCTVQNVAGESTIIRDYLLDVHVDVAGQPGYKHVCDVGDENEWVFKPFTSCVLDGKPFGSVDEVQVSEFQGVKYQCVYDAADNKFKISEVVSHKCRNGDSKTEEGLVKKCRDEQWVATHCVLNGEETVLIQLGETYKQHNLYQHYCKPVDATNSALLERIACLIGDEIMMPDDPIKKDKEGKSYECIRDASGEVQKRMVTPGMTYIDYMALQDGKFVACAPFNNATGLLQFGETMDTPLYRLSCTPTKLISIACLIRKHNNEIKKVLTKGEIGYEMKFEKAIKIECREDEEKPYNVKRVEILTVVRGCYLDDGAFVKSSQQGHVKKTTDAGLEYTVVYKCAKDAYNETQFVLEPVHCAVGSFIIPLRNVSIINDKVYRCEYKIAIDEVILVETDSDSLDCYAGRRIKHGQQYTEHIDRYHADVYKCEFGHLIKIKCIVDKTTVSVSETLYCEDVAYLCSDGVGPKQLCNPYCVYNGKNYTYGQTYVDANDMIYKCDIAKHALCTGLFWSKAGCVYNGEELEFREVKTVSRGHKVVCMIDGVRNLTEHECICSRFYGNAYFDSCTKVCIHTCEVVTTPPPRTKTTPTRPTKPTPHTKATTPVPTGEPSTDPTGEPSTDPTGEPSTDPTGEPSTDPTGEPSTDHTGEPSTDPTGEPSTDPTGEPSTDPTGEPSTDPTGEPSTDPTGEPSTDPTGEPSTDPTGEPSTDPTGEPSTDPTGEPSTDPTEEPSTDPTGEPSTDPTGEPSTDPTGEPSTDPTGETPDPTEETSDPTGETSDPTGEPSTVPTGSTPTHTPPSNCTGIDEEVCEKLSVYCIDTIIEYTSEWFLQCDAFNTNIHGINNEVRKLKCQQTFADIDNIFKKVLKNVARLKTDKVSCLNDPDSFIATLVPVFVTATHKIYGQYELEYSVFEQFRYYFTNELRKTLDLEPLGNGEKLKVPEQPNKDNKCAIPGKCNSCDLWEQQTVALVNMVKYMCPHVCHTTHLMNDVSFGYKSASQLVASGSCQVHRCN